MRSAQARPALSCSADLGLGYKAKTDSRTSDTAVAKGPYQTFSEPNKAGVRLRRSGRGTKRRNLATSKRFVVTTRVSLFPDNMQCVVHPFQSTGFRRWTPHAQPVANCGSHTLQAGAQGSDR